MYVSNLSVWNVILAEKHSQKMQKPKLRSSTAMAMELGVKPRVPVLPLVIDLEEVEIPRQSSSSPESTLTSTAIGKRLYGNFDEERDFANDEDEAAATFSGGNSGGGGGGGERKKLRLTKEQIMVLEKAFSEQSTVNTVSLSRSLPLILTCFGRKILPDKLADSLKLCLLEAKVGVSNASASKA